MGKIEILVDDVELNDVEPNGENGVDSDNESELDDSDQEQQAVAPEDGDDLLTDDSAATDDTDAMPDEDIPEPDILTEQHKTWVNRTKRANKRLANEVDELKRKIASIDEYALPVIPDKKPTLVDFDLDEDAFAEAILEYNKQVEAANKAKERTEAERTRFLTQYQDRQKAYKKSRSEATKKVHGFVENEKKVIDDFNVTKQDVIIAYSENPVALINALGKDEKRRKELAAINDLPEFVFRMGKLDQALKSNMEKRAKPAADTSLKSEAASATDAKLEQLRKQAEKTGNFTEVIKYRRQLKQRK